MSFLSVLLYIVQGTALRRALVRTSPPSDAIYLALFSRLLVGQEKCPSKLSAALEQGINAAWEDVYDFVNPFGDRRGDSFNSVWTFDLHKDLIFLTKKDRHCSAPLGLARERLLTQDDFELVSPHEQKPQDNQTLPGPYWEPAFDPMPRETSFLGRVLHDFAYTWRHVIRREMNTIPFMKLAYAIIWISRIEFTLLERVGFEHIAEGGPYARVTDLPGWDTPEAMLVPTGSSWFVLSQDISEGLEMVRRHATGQSLRNNPTTKGITYAILTLRRVVLCKVFGDELVWTKPEKLFHDNSAPSTGIDLVLSTSRIENRPISINRLPVEIQDGILRHATVSLVAAAKLGCELGLGSPFSWVDRGVAISIIEVKRHRGESSPVESQLILNGVKSGLSYKRERGYQVTHRGRNASCTTWQTQYR
ncbi:hypothetical protein B0I35DRAFT_90330 [Stachybotrys elegans]|uniref:Heterokaryon incompatibility domain-containing protein n=1 Tax=Stachybotrys elegans TaxID=80388 RepID=A0A8K0SLI6_9HYPO|nr:hypothetical protein B0I35DRAFT_90330 [Stachybotrys elegans]